MSKVEWIECYHVRGHQLGGWAVVHIDSRGFLGVVSDYGNFAYHWSSFGTDFKKFLTELDWDYLYGKLMHGRDAWVYDGKATLDGILKHILELRRGKRLSRERARAEWNLAEDSEIDHHHSTGFSFWCRDTQLEAAHELYETTTDWQCEAFCKKIWPHFIEKLKVGDRCELEPAGSDLYRQAALAELLATWHAGKADAAALLAAAFDRAVAFMRGSQPPQPAD